MNERTNNVDFEEIKKFSSHSQDWWDPNGILKSLHEINPLRLAFILKYGNLASQKVLDVGCGGGILSESMARLGAEVCGIDLAAESIQVATQHAKKNKLMIDYQVVSVEDLAASEPESFDSITCMELLEHVPDPNSIIKSCYQLLKPNGLLFMSTINKNLKSYFQAIIAAEYILRIVPQKTHEYKKFITPAGLTRMCRENNLDLLGIEGFSYNPLNKAYFLTPNCEVNYLIALQKKQPQ